MKVLFIGGTGVISTEVSKLAVERGIELYLFNRGQRSEDGIPGAHHQLTGDINEPQGVQKALEGLKFDAVVDWIAYKEADIARDLEIFRGRTDQYIFISSASVYQKPPTYYIVTESTPLHNPYWQYARDKIVCEEYLIRAYREEGFPITIVRPSYTYDRLIPSAIGGWRDFTLIDRMRKGKPIIIHGDGSSLFTLTHAADFAKGFVGLLANPQATGHAFHITSDEVLTWTDIYQTFADAAGAPFNPVYIPSDFIARHAPRFGGGLLGDKTWSLIFDNSKIKRFVPDYQATISLREGIRGVIDWFEANPTRQIVNGEVNAKMDALIAAYGDISR